MEIFVAKTLRVHHLAKELGVPSKEIVAKCNAEGVSPPLKNHMAAVAIGLAESIREWFSAGADVTTIEVASRVDLSKVKKKSRKKAKPADAGPLDEQKPVAEVVAIESPATTEAPEQGIAAHVDAGSASASTGVSVVETPIASKPAVTAEEDRLETVVEREEASVQPPVIEVAALVEETPTPMEDKKPVEESTDTAVLEPLIVEPQKPAGPIIVPEPVKAEPAEPVEPVGPKLVPKAAELKGPRIVRIEAPERVRAPRPRGPRPPGTAQQQSPTTPTAPGVQTPWEPGTGQARGRGGQKQPAPGAAARARSPRRRPGGAETYTERLKEWRDQDLIDRKERLASATGHGVKARRTAERRKGGGAGSALRKDDVEITAPLTLKDFCAAVGTPFNIVFAKIVEQTGKLSKITDMIDAETAELVALDLGVTLKIKKAKTEFEKLVEQHEQRERVNLKPRPPVVAMLGHVDHGKTSLLDAVRKSDVVSGEAGGITQHIGAYQIQRGDWRVTFLDTPGHEAFTAMRARGANMTDVVVLVIAADDGVMPQTVEAINHAKAAEVQIVVALNKIDLPGVDLNKIYAQLADQELIPAEWGGDTDIVKTSATKGEGIDDLIAHLSTLSELLDLKADATIPARGVVIEAQMHEGRGVGVQTLVQEGTLKIGQVVTCGPGAGRVRNLLDHRGKRIKQAGPGTPVEIVGLDEIPEAGEQLYVVDSLPQAKEIAGEIKAQRREEQLKSIRKPQTLEELFSGAGEDEIPELNVIIKADVQGSVDVLKASLDKFPSDKARLQVLHSGVGAITEADVELGRASKALLLGFHVVADDRARGLADQYGVEIRLYRVIYDVHDDLYKALEGLLVPEQSEEGRGKVEVRQVFSISRVGRIAGCLVVDGTVARNHRVRLVRDGRVVVEDKAIGSLKRFKDDAREVRAGMECGVKIEGYDDLKPGDILDTYEIVEVAQTL